MSQEEENQSEALLICTEFVESLISSSVENSLELNPLYDKTFISLPVLRDSLYDPLTIVQKDKSIILDPKKIFPGWILPELPLDWHTMPSLPSPNMSERVQRYTSINYDILIKRQFEFIASHVTPFPEFQDTFVSIDKGYPLMNLRSYAINEDDLVCSNLFSLGILTDVLIQEIDKTQPFLKKFMETPLIVNGNDVPGFARKLNKGMLDENVPDLVPYIRYNQYDAKYGFIAYGTDFCRLTICSAVPNLPGITLVCNIEYESVVVSIDITKRTFYHCGKNRVEYTFLTAVREYGICADNTVTPTTYKLVKDISVSDPFQEISITDAKISPDLKHAFFIGDDGGIWLAYIKYERFESKKRSFENREHNVWTSAECMMGKATHWNFQNFFKVDVNAFGWAERHLRNSDEPVLCFEMSWSLDSRFVAVSSDSHPILMLYQIDKDNNTAFLKHVFTMAGPVYAITFHPVHCSVLAFAYSCAHVTIVDVKAIMDMEEASAELINLPIQMIPFAQYYSEKEVNDRILFCKEYCEIDGMEWSYDGRWLNVATDSGVFVYPYKKLAAETLEQLCMESIYGRYQMKDLDTTIKIFDDQEVVDRLMDWGSDFDWFPHWLR